VSVPFNAQQGLILVEAELEGPTARYRLQLALDTGATETVIGTGWLAAVGYDLSQAQQVTVTTASGVELVALLPVIRLTALGQDRTAFPVVGLTLPAGIQTDGVLGLDFFRGQVLTIDFRAGQVTLS
jgi:hypothetical protein